MTNDDEKSDIGFNPSFSLIIVLLCTVFYFICSNCLNISLTSYRIFQDQTKLNVFFLKPTNIYWQAGFNQPILLSQITVFVFVARYVLEDTMQKKMLGVFKSMCCVCKVKCMIISN